MSKTRNSDGRGLIVGTIVNPAGLTLAKTIAGVASLFWIS